MPVIRAWDGVLTTEETDEILRELVGLHLQWVSDPAKQEVGACITRHLDSGDVLALCNLELDYRELSVIDSLHLRQILGFYTKRGDYELGIDRKAVAFEKFEDSELRCSETNRLFKSWGAGNFQFLPAVESALYEAQQKISQVLGDCPNLDQLRLKFGPGATTQVAKRYACAKVKLSQKACCSDNLLPIVSDLLEEIPGYTFAGVETESAPVAVEVHPGVLDFVPKNARTERCIVKEPWLNGILQLGLGHDIAAKLRRFGIDTKDQTKNRRLAQKGSITGALATLDLSSASDLISTKLVEHLVAPDWFDLLNRARTKWIKTPKGLRSLEKFSSMGNGFTFPLETLIFWALVRGCCTDRETVSVYGDDIICPTWRVPLVLQVLNAVGFVVNKEKSFFSGPFRESCGGDYLSGIDIRPCYLKGPLSGLDAFRLHNFYMRNGFPEFAAVVRKHIDPTIALTGPDGFGDGHLVGLDWQPVRQQKHVARGFGGVTFDTWSFKKRSFKKRLPGDRILPGYSAYLREKPVMTPLQDCLYEDRRFRASLIFGDRPDIAEEYLLGYRFTSEGVPVEHLPGTDGCKRISIYTLEPS